jgi:transposase
MRKTLSLDLRERIVEAYDAKEGTREEVARRFKVSLGMVKKLLTQRAKTGELGARHRFSGRKARLMPLHGAQLKSLVAKQPDATLVEMKQRLGLNCTVAAIHVILTKLGLTYKKRRCMQLNNNAPTSPGNAKPGSASKADSIRRNLSSSTSRRPRQT